CRGGKMTLIRHCERSEAIQLALQRLDCFVTSLLAMTRMRLATIIASLAVVGAFAGAAWWITTLGPAPVGSDLEFSATVVDREDRLLRAYATGEGRWRLPATVADVDPRFFAVLFAYEDKRFRAHHGVDPLALLRAALQLASSGHIR